MAKQMVVMLKKLGRKAPGEKIVMSKTDARVLALLGVARYARENEQSMEAIDPFKASAEVPPSREEVEAELKPQPRRRTYRRRDMQAEE